jgi:hypothetical protein
MYYKQLMMKYFSMSYEEKVKGGKLMKHIIFYSGGLGSWMTAKRVAKQHGKENVICLFTDTLIEDEDLYRFLIETTQDIFGIDQRDLIEQAKDIPPTSHETMPARKAFLTDLAAKVSARNPQFIWINDGRDPWEIFRDVRFLGNSRLAQCSHKIKQELAARYIHGNFTPDECMLYLGIDWTEEHRTKAPRKNWAPYQVEFPMCEEPLLTKIDAIKALEEAGTSTPRLYGMGFSHNNCGGFCVRAGQGHFVNLLEKSPELYHYHEEKEQEMRDFLGKEVAILKKTRKKVTTPLTLRELRLEHEAGSDQIDMFDIGGCGCFVDDEASE